MVALERGKPLSFFIENPHAAGFWCGMNASAPLSFSSFVLSPSFWSKRAEHQSQAPDEESQRRILGAFVDEMHKAGASPFMLVGMFDEMSGRTQKEAQGGRGMPPASTPPAAPAAPAAPANPNKIEPNDGIWNSTKAFFGSQDAARAKALAVASKEHPVIDVAAKSIYGDNDVGRADMYLKYNDGDTSGAIGDLFGAIKASPAVKEWAPAVLPALGALGMGRLSGLGWGGSLALAGGAGLIGREAGAAGGYGKLFQNVRSGLSGAGAPPVAPPQAAAAQGEPVRTAAPAAPTAPAAAPAAPEAAAPVKNTQDQGEAPATKTKAEQTQQANSENASEQKVKKEE